METKKQKIIKILKRVGMGLSIGFNIVFLLAIIIGSTANKKQVNCCLAESDNVVEKLDIKQDNRRYLSNVDGYAYIDNSDLSLIYSYVSYLVDNNTASLNDVADSSSYMELTVSNGDSVVINFEGSLLGANYYSVSHDIYFSDEDGTYAIYFYENNFNVSDENSGTIYDSIDYEITFAIYMNSNGTIINGLVNFVPPTINDGIFETLTEGVTAFIGSIGSGIVAMTSVFYDSSNSQLTTIGLLSVIVVAVSLSYFLFRLIIGLIRMRG